MTSQNNTTPAPTRIEWRRDGYTVWADEDGVHLQTPGNGFEMPEAIALVELYQQVLTDWRNDESFDKPTRPTRQQIYTHPAEYTARRAMRVVSNALKSEFFDDDSTISPF